MDKQDSAAAAAFRAEVQTWLAANAPPYQWGPGTSDEDRFRLCREWMKVKADAGYAGIYYPKEIGGRGGTPLEDIIFREEEWKWMNGSFDESAGGNLVGMAIPAVLTHAQPGWAERLIPKTLSGEYLWCQLFSEPSGGSDMAGVRTRVVRCGDDWLVNGQKIWTSGAIHADWGLLLARSNPSKPKHKGLTAFLLDMKTPGIEIRPLKQISGRADFNEVFFTDVRIPDDARLGEVDGGWAVALTIMMNERYSLLYDPSTSRDVIAPLIRIAARTESVNGGRLIDDPAFKEKLASYHVVVAGMHHARARIREVLGAGNIPGPEASIGKLLLSQWLQEMCAYVMDVAGPAGQAVEFENARDLAVIQENYFLAVGYRIGGGTPEIARNIIAERLLGLPQDDRPDKDLPFSEVPISAASDKRRHGARR